MDIKEAIVHLYSPDLLKLLQINHVITDKSKGNESDMIDASIVGNIFKMKHKS